ncbi:hypothetical protein BOX15_Mlig000371g2, partial [Macrostomum lignano]
AIPAFCSQIAATSAPLKAGGQTTLHRQTADMKATLPPMFQLLLPLLLLLDSPARLSAGRSQLPLGLTQTVLQHRKVIDIQDAMDRQLLYTLATTRHEQFVFQSSSNLPTNLFATVVPCLSPVEFEFRKLAGPRSRPMKLRSLEADYYRPPGENLAVRDNHQLVSRYSATHRLETSGTQSLSMRLGAFGNATKRLQRLGSTKVLIKLSTRYPSIELGTSRYNLQVCDPGGRGGNSASPQQIRIRVSHMMAAARQLHNQMYVCVVVNSIRPLHQYCSAQIALAGALPHPHEGLLDGTKRYALPIGSYAYNCTSYASLYRQDPLVNVSRLLESRDPSVLYVNAYLVWPGSDGQAESVAWHTSMLHRKDPQTGIRQPFVSCSQQYYVESSTDLLPVPGTDNGVYEATVSVQMPPNTSLLVRPSRLDMVGSAYRVEITPYSGQSDSFAINAANYSCNDSVWPYGGVACGRDLLHMCLTGDSEACRYDSIRLLIRLEHKIKDQGQPGQGPIRHRRANAESWTTKPRQFQWQFVHLANTERPDIVQPRIGRVDEAINLLWELYNSVENMKVLRSPDAYGPQSQRRERAARACELTLKQREFRRSSKRLVKETAKCYKKLLQLHMHVQHHSRTNVPFLVQIASPRTANLVAHYTASSNGYICLVFELGLVQSLQNRISKMRLRSRLYQFKKAYKRIVRDVETRLLSTVSTIDLPSNKNQGFGTNASEKSIRKIRHLEKDEPVEFMKLIYENRSAPGNYDQKFLPTISNDSLNKVDPNGSRMFAIYIYAVPSERLRQAALSLFAFRVYTLDEEQRVNNNYNELRKEYRQQKRRRAKRRRQEKRNRRRQKQRKQRQRKRRRQQRHW